MKRTLLLLAIAVLLVAVGISAFAGGVQEKSTAAEEKRQVHVLTVWDETEPTVAKVLYQLTELYRGDHPNFSANFELVPQTDLVQKVKVLVASNDTPELFNYESGPPLAEFADNGVVVNIETAFKDLGIFEELNPVAVSLLKRVIGNNQLYAIPIELNVEGFWYNRDLFAQYNLQVPQTFQQLESVASTLYDNGVQPFAVAGRESWPITRLINAIVMRISGPDAAIDAGRGERPYTDSGFVTAAQTVQSWAQKGYLGRAVVTLDYATAQDLFLQGRAAMYYMGSWVVRDFNDPNVNQLPDGAIGFFNIPVWEGGVDRTTANKTYSVNAGQIVALGQSKFDPAMQGWTRFVFKRFGQSAMDSLGLITGFRAEIGNEVTRYTKLVANELQKAQISALWFEASMGSRLQQQSWDLAQGLVVGEVEPEEWAQAMTRAATQQ